MFPIRPGRFVATYSFALFCEISYLINGFYFPFFCDLRFLTKRNLYSLDFSSLNRNNRSISCNIMQNLGACCWLVHLFDACFQRFGINLTFLVGFSNLNTFDENAAARSAAGRMLVHGLGQSAEVAMRFSLVCFKKNTNSQLFSSTPLQSLVIYHFSSKFHSNRWLQIAPLARRPFWNHFESGYFFGPKLSFQIIHLKKRVALMLIESRTK